MSEAPGSASTSVAGPARRAATLAQQLLRARSGGWAELLGARIALYPHQLHTARRALHRDPVRWLLADEVGLGKTVEACMVLSALIRAGRAASALVVAPDTLTVQWLGELYRKFQQVFTHLDDKRLADVAREAGRDENPLQLAPFAIVSLERMLRDPRLREQALAAAPDVLVVDEAHRLCRGDGEALLAPLFARARHAVLLTATPLSADLRGFHRLLRLLHPARFADFDAFARALRGDGVQVECTSAVRRQDVGGLPRRVARPVLLADGSLAARAAWLLERLPGWRSAASKVLAFAGTEAMAELAARVERAAAADCLSFDPRHPADRRALALHRFMGSEHTLLLCPDAAAEGCNFQGFDAIVCVDLPAHPMLLEQRIGRVDRIGRRGDIELFYFPGADGEGARAALYERLELFSRPAAGIEDVLLDVQRVVESGGEVDVEAFARRAAGVRRGAGRAVVRAFYPDAYAAEHEASIRAEMPRGLEALTRAFCRAAAEALDAEVVERGDGTHFFGFSARFGGVLPGARCSSYLGTFDRELALVRPDLDFFASGHELVECLLELTVDLTASGAATP